MHIWNFLGNKEVTVLKCPNRDSCWVVVRSSTQSGLLPNYPFLDPKSGEWVNFIPEGHRTEEEALNFARSIFGPSMKDLDEPDNPTLLAYDEVDQQD